MVLPERVFVFQSHIRLFQITVRKQIGSQSQGGVMVGERFLFCVKHYHCLIQVYILTMQQHGEPESTSCLDIIHIMEKNVSAPLLDM